MKPVRHISVSSTIFVVFTSFYLLHIQSLWPKAHCNSAKSPLCSFEAHESSAWHCFHRKTLPHARHFRYPCAFLPSRINNNVFPYCANGTSTCRLIKVRLSGDVEENPRAAITGVRGVSGPPHIANSGQHGASLLPSNHTNTNLLSVFYTKARSIAIKRSFLNLGVASNAYDIDLLTETHLYNT